MPLKTDAPALTARDSTAWPAPPSSVGGRLIARPAAGGPALAAVAVLVAAAWAALLAQARRAGGDEQVLAVLCQPDLGLASPGLAAFLRDWAAASSLWVLMSTAMMLPTAVPMLVSYREAAGRAVRCVPSTGWLAGGYLAVWCAVSVLAGLLQVGGHRLLTAAASGLAVPTGVSPVLAGLVVGAAGLYQFSPLKLRCLTFCRRDICAEELPNSISGAVRLGLRQGLGCLGCCGAMMALMLLAGFANLFWMAAFALLMTVEKLSEGLWAVRLTGVLLIGAGFAVAALPVGPVAVLGAFFRLVTGGAP